jgi:hypothetical protein
MKMLALLTLIFFAQQPTKLPEGNGIPKGESSQVSQQPDGREHNNNASNSTPGIAKGTKPSEQAAPADQDVDIQRTLTNYTGLLVLVGFITAGAIIWQSWHTRRAADAANRNIEATMNERRARIEIIASHVAATSVKPEGPYIVSVSLKNIGPTVGTIRGVSARLVESAEEVEPNYRECTRLGLTGTIPPNDKSSEVTIIQKMEGQSVIHFYGFALYEDVYGRTHRVKVHIQWGGDGIWIIAGKPAENSDIEEKRPHKSWMQRLTEFSEKSPPWISPN